MLKDWDNYGETDALYVTLSYIVEVGESFNRNEFVDTIKSMAFKNEDKIMTIAELFKQEGFSKGIEQGKFEAAHEIAYKMLTEKLSFETVKRVTGLSDNEIQKLSQIIH